MKNRCMSKKNADILNSGIQAKDHMNNPFTTTFQNIIEPKSFRKILPQPLKKSFFHAFCWYLTISASAALYVTIFLAPMSFETVKSLTNDISTEIPQDLQITIANNTLSTNNPEPITIPLSQPITSTINAAMIIDTQRVAEDIKDTQSLLLLTSNALAMRTGTDPSDYNVISWERLQLDGTTTGAQIKSEVENIARHTQNIAPFVFPLSIVAILLALTTIRLPLILLYSLPIASISILMGRRIGYKSALKISLHAIVIAELINIILTLVYKSQFPNIFLLTYLGITTIALYALPKKIILKKR